MNLTELGDLIISLTDPANGEAVRIDFNADPGKHLAKLDGDEIETFLTFNKAKIADEVHARWVATDEHLTKAALYADFIQKLAGFSWPNGGAQKYPCNHNPKAGGGLAPLYGGPKCRISRVDATATLVAGTEYKVDLQVYVQGALPSCRIIVRDGNGSEVQSAMATIAPNSTFRCTLLSATMVFDNKSTTATEYHVSVENRFNGMDVELSEGSNEFEIP